MNKLKYKKTVQKPIPGYDKDFYRFQNQLLCQVQVPGVGRMRTGEIHSNFHITESDKRMDADRLEHKKA